MKYECCANYAVWLLYGISTTEGGGVSVVGAIYSCSILSKLEHEQRRKFYSAFISRNDRNDLVALCLELYSFASAA